MYNMNTNRNVQYQHELQRQVEKSIGPLLTQPQDILIPKKDENSKHDFRAYG